MLSSDLIINTQKKMELVDITALLNKQVANSNVDHGSCFVFNPHTTAGLTINEGADPAVRDDIINGMQKIVPMSFPFQHLEGNSPAHIMASLMGCSLTLLIENRQIFLGTWQRIFFCEFDGPRRRKVKCHITSNS